MNQEKKIANAKLGALVLAGLLFLVFSLYMIGKNQNIFGSSIIVIAELEEVSGLLPGNNVRFKGMDIGTVSNIEMITDSTIHVRMLVHKSMVPFIQSNAKTTINSDGLMGNKIIQIHPQDQSARPLEAGDILYPMQQLDTDKLIEQLGNSGDYLQKSLINLAEITEKLNQSEILWSVLAGADFSLDLKEAVREFRQAGVQVSQLAAEGKSMITELRAGEGLVNSLFLDTLNAEKLQSTMIQLEQATQEARQMMQHLNTVLAQVENGTGTAGMVISDSVFKAQIIRTMENVEQSTYNFNQNMEALRRNFLFRRYFRDKEKKN